MNSKDPNSNKKQLLDDLKSLKDALDEDDDNVPLLLDDDDIPILDDDDDIPVLSPDTQALKAADKASLEAAMRQLESMELAPSHKPATRQQTVAPKQSIEDKIRNNAGTPRINNAQLTQIKENPFLNNNQKAQLEQNRQLQEEAQRTALIATLNKQATAKPMTPAASNAGEPIDFTDNPFLTASASSAKTNTSATPTQEKPKAAAPHKKTEELSIDELNIDAELADIDNELSGLGDIIIPEDNDETEAPLKTAFAPTTQTKKLTDKEINLVLDEVIDEYMVILEAALRKKLKEKLPDLLK